ncbi:MAG TPA: vitamin K epoxide reductase family protein [Thermomicrobiales bacterium]|nr:vitamin K epoxide reductase family protein [Thermomicrobiales bacterium]
MQLSPATNRLTALSLALAAGGIAVSAYLTLVHYRDDLLVCAVGGCHTVQKSPYAELYGVPVAILGLGMFVAMLLLGLLRRIQPEWAESITLITFGLALTGTVFTIYLTYLELFVIHAVCQWCVLTAVLTWVLLLVEGRLVLDTPLEELAEDR